MRQLSAANVLLIQSLEDNRAEFLQMLALTSIVDEHGQPLFDDSDKEFLADQPVSVYNDLVQGFLRANHLTDNAVDELKKNSVARGCIAEILSGSRVADTYRSFG